MNDQFLYLNPLCLIVTIKLVNKLRQKKLQVKNLGSWFPLNDRRFKNSPPYLPDEPKIIADPLLKWKKHINAS